MTSLNINPINQSFDQSLLQSQSHQQSQNLYDPNRQLLNQGESHQQKLEGQVPRVGTGLLIIKKGKVLVGKRKGSHAAGLYSFPGGKLDWFENWDECVLREKNEECGEGLKVAIRYFGAKRKEFFVTNDIMPQYNQHYITIFMVADWVEGEPVNMEPHKNEFWEWMDFDQLAALAQNGECANWIPMDLIEAFRHTIGI